MSLSFSWGRGPAIFSLLGGLFVIIAIILVVVFVNAYTSLQHYQAGHCTITAKQLVQQVEHDTHSSNGHTYTTTTLVYKPDFQFTVLTTNNKSYSAEGYDILGSTSSNQSEQQAIVDQYSVGKTYPCWYDPTNPTQAVLTQQFNAFIFFIPAIFFIVGALFLIVGIATAFRRL